MGTCCKITRRKPMKRTLLLAACFLLAGCLSETSEPEMPGVRVIKVRETAKITTAWETEAVAWKLFAEDLQRERRKILSYPAFFRAAGEYASARHSEDLLEMLQETLETAQEGLETAQKGAEAGRTMNLEKALSQALSMRDMATGDGERFKASEAAAKAAMEAWEATFEAVELPNE